MGKQHKQFDVNGETVWARNKAWAAIAAVKQEIVSGEDLVVVTDPADDTQSTFIMGIQSSYWRTYRQDNKTDRVEHEDGC